MSTHKLAINGGAPLRARPFHRWPIHDDEDLRRLEKVLDSGHWSGDGELERRFERAFAKRHDGLDSVAMSNGTVTLLACLRALGIRPGEEVIVPALTWIATATAVLEANGVPVMVDVEPKTFCIDPKAVSAAITSRTVAIIPVHLYSCMADMDAIDAIASKHGLAVVEDCAHAHGAAWKGRGAGSLGSMGSFSFQSSKVMTAGEGGAVIARERALLDKLYSLRNCGRSMDGRGSPMLGGNQRMTEWQSAILLGQLERLDDHIARREESIARLRQLLSEVKALSVVEDQRRVTARPCYRLSFHYDRRAAGGIPLRQFVAAVRAEGVPIESTYRTVYENSLYNTAQMSWYPYAARTFECPVAEDISLSSAFELPHQILLGDDQDLADVAAAFQRVLDHPLEAANIKSRVKSGVKGLLRRLK